MPLPTVPSTWKDLGSVLIYRDISISGGTINSLEQQVVLEPSNTDLLYHKFKISFTGWIHSESLPGFGPFVGTKSLAPASPQAMAMELQKWLMQPRGDLFLYTEGVLLFQSRGLDDIGITGGRRNRIRSGSVDANGNIDENPDYAVMAYMDVVNGPHPVSCTVNFVAGFRAFQVQYEITTCLAKCDPELIALNPSSAIPAGWPTPEVPPGSAWNPAILSNKWSISETRDANFLLTRTISGKLTCRSYTFPATNLRDFCIPKLSRGYQRVRMDFMQSPDGLSLVYSITDQQRYAAPPRPAIDWRATHSEDVEAFGQQGISSISVWLRGTIGTPKSQLFTAAVKVIEHRLGLFNKEECQAIPISSSVVDNMHEPEIQVSMRLKRTILGPDAGQAKRYANLIFGTLGKLPPVNAIVLPEGGPEANLNDAERNDQQRSQYNRDKWPAPTPFDSTSPAVLFRAYLQSPCVGYHGIPDPDAPVNDKPVGENETGYVEPGGPVIAVYVGETSGIEIEDDSTSQISPEHINNIYTHYEIESKYVTDEGIQPVALARPQASPTSNQVVAIRVSHPVTYRDVWIRAKRGGEYPKIPESPLTISDPNNTNITETRIYQNVVNQPPKLLTNGFQYEYEIEMCCRYMLSRTPGATERLRAGSLPWDVTTPTDNLVTISDIQSPTII